jgi:hypothetical protein
MSIYPSPKLHNGSLNTIFNNTDYIKVVGSGGGGLTVKQTDALYLKNSGVVVSSANTFFNGTLNVGALCTVNNIKVNTLATIESLNVLGLQKSKQTTDTLTSDVFRADQLYSFSNGMVYSIISDATTVNSVSFINIPTTINQSYIFTFILRPSAVNSPYYIKPSSNTIVVNSVSIPLYGLQNVTLPTNYTFLVQQISIIYNIYSSSPQFIALTSVSGY